MTYDAYSETLESEKQKEGKVSVSALSPHWTVDIDVPIVVATKTKDIAKTGTTFLLFFKHDKLVVL